MHVALQEPKASKVGALCKYSAGQVRIGMGSGHEVEAHNAVLKPHFAMLQVACYR